jgi:TRAP-type C4-dicarboxylate transport system permease small subunit
LNLRAALAFDRLLDACAFAACLLLVFQVASVTLEVVLRLAFDISLSWVTAFNEWSLLLVTFLGAAWLEREGGHTRDDSMIERAGPRVHRLSDIVGRLLGLLICALLVWYGFTVAWEKFSRNEFDFFKMREVPVFWVYLAIPLGSLLWFVQILRRRRPPPPTTH